MQSQREALESQLAALVARDGRINLHLRQPLEADSEDAAATLEGEEVVTALGDATREDIDAIRAALSRIDAGTYGVCTRCGGEIAAGRLQALPATPHCSACAD